MKWNIQNAATWKGGICKAQTHAGRYHRIHQPNSNSSSWNIWTMISLIKCFTQSLEKKMERAGISSLCYMKEDWASLQTAGKSVMTANPKCNEQPGLGASLWERQGLKQPEKKVFLLAGLPRLVHYLMQLLPEVPNFHPSFPQCLGVQNKPVDSG